MKKLISTIVFIFIFIFPNTSFAADMTIIKCGGYVGYDDKFIYLNWQEDKKEFRDKLPIRERAEKYIMATLPTSDKIEIKKNGRYITYSVHGRERINYLCRKAKLEQLL
jgi:predicted nucleotidyltransferase